jgi:hypothetical protein
MYLVHGWLKQKQMVKKTVKSTKRLFTAIVTVLLLSAVAGSPELKAQKAWIIKPDDNYADILDKLQPGDELILHEGVYEGYAVLRNSGLPDKPIVIRGYGNGENRPVLTWDGRRETLLQINGSNVIIDFLEFRSKYRYAIRLGISGQGNRNVIIQNCLFYESGGGDISANALADYDNIKILDNYFIGPKATPVYIGQHDGKINVTNFLFKGNIIDGSQISGENIIGYGIQLKLNVTGGLIENNLITNTQGPCIMVYGAEDSSPQNANIVRNNIVIGSRNNPGIVIGGGPSVVAGNLAIGCNGGISIINYGNRNLPDNIVLEGNTAACNRNYGISFGDLHDLTATDNVVISLDGVNGFIRNPDPGINNRIYDASPGLEAIVSEQLLNVIPERKNLNEIWQRLSLRPLNQTGVLEIIELILEHGIPLKKPEKTVF